MANPVSRSSATQLPPISHPFVNDEGMVDIAWYQTLLALFERTGGPGGTSAGTVQETANQALIIAQSIAGLASAANTEATSALNLATFANSTAQTALTTAQSASTGVTTLNSTALVKANNLNDVGDLSLTRSNLHANKIDALFNFHGSVTSNQSAAFPLLQPVSIPASFAGTYTFCRTPPTANTVFGVNYWRNNLAYNIGSITLINATNQTRVMAGSAIDLLAGDVIELLAPAGTDATLANVSISLALFIK